MRLNSHLSSWMLLAALVCSLPAAQAAVIDWSDGAGNDLWSAAANWSGVNTPPLATDVARFLNTGAAAAAGTVTNIADAPFGGVIGGIQFDNTTGNFHTTSLAGGALQVNGDLVVNRDLFTSVVAWFTAGSLTVGSAPTRRNIFVGYAPTSDPTSTVIGTLDLSGLTQFNATLTDFSIGVRILSGANDPDAQGIVVLAPSNTIDATNITVSQTGMWGVAPPQSTLTLGASNTLKVDTFTVAGMRGTGQVTLPAGGTLNLSGSSGPAADLLIGYNAMNTGNPAVGTMNVSAGTFNATLDDLIIGYHTSKTGGSGTGTLTLGANTNVTANRIVIGDAGIHPVDGAGTGVGTLNMAGGTITVAGDVTLATGTSTSTGRINMTPSTLAGGVFTIGGNVVDGPGVSTLNIEGGTMNVAGSLGVDDLTVGLNGKIASLDVNGPSVTIGSPSRRATVYVGRRTAGGATPTTRGTADFSDANSLTAYVSNLIVGSVTTGGSPDNPAYGTLLLADSNYIDATTIMIADSTAAGLGGDTSRIRLGLDNTIRVGTLTIGGNKSLAVMDFFSPGSTLNLTGPGGGRANVNIALQTVSTGGGANGTLNLTGQTINALINNLVIGSKPNSATGTTTGTFTMDGGTVDANAIVLARRTVAGTSGIVRGYFNLNGGTLTAGSINHSTTIPNTASDVYQFNWTAGTLHVGTFGSATAPFNLLNTGTGTLAPGASAGRTDIYGNYTQGPNATLDIELGGYAQGVTYDYVTATGTATIDGLLRVSVLPGFNLHVFDTFDVFQANDIILASGFNLLNTYGGVFLYEVIPGPVSGEVLRLTFLPEPGTMALLGLGLLALARRRRARQAS